ncbi:hypothetical protein AMK59_2506 [Oryctes borbonicus]|uniref:H/ACA ribonucleoprotein complex non-core subunit NAF1 n=1 Tax=Oryctes borbonicus TaxID=1629725 RepID=A0A0T6BCY5_9SCAR|nr:hypothetical protein AMK59_2506 [Oryctes borbonicus]
MEDQKTKSPCTGDEQTEAVDNEKKSEDNPKEAKTDRTNSAEGDKGDVARDREDNLNDDNSSEKVQPSKNEADEIKPVVKGNKPSESENVDSSSSGNTSNDQGTVTVIRTGNSSLSNLLVYSSESSDSSDSESSSSESESYESPEVSDNDQESEGAKTENKKKNVQDTIRTFGELTLDELPPVADVSSLNVEVTEHECIHMGNVSGIIDRLVTVESLPNIPAYDLETLLFLDNGKKPLGYVYDVMGPVSNPIYVIRFNTKEEMDSVGVTKGLPVYSAPKTPHTQYVFLKQLMQVKGSDASWMGDNEVPAEHVDYSDDEEERRVRRASKKCLSSETRKRNSLERHKDFEKDMNVKNIIDTRLHKIRDSFEPSTKRHASNNNDKRGFPFQPNATGPVFSFGQPGLNPNVPSFNPFLSAPFMPNGMQMPPFGPIPYMPPLARMPPVQNVPFIPSIPPPQLPQTMTSQTMAPPPMQAIHTITVPPPTMDMGQQKHPQQIPPRMLYPPDMGMARAPRGAFVPLYTPRIPSVWTYPNRPQTMRPTQNFCQPRPRATYYPKK